MSYAMLYNHRLGCREQSFGQRFDAECRCMLGLVIMRSPSEYIFKSRDKKMSVRSFAGDFPGYRTAVSLYIVLT